MFRCIILVLFFVLLSTVEGEVIEKRVFHTIDYVASNFERSIVPITYHGGPVMNTPFKIHTVFYGTKFQTGGSTILSNFLTALNSSAWWSINRQYSKPEVPNSNVSNVIKGITKVNQYTLGKSLTDASILKLVDWAIANKMGTGSTTDVYMILTDSTVQATSGLCTVYCGYHSYRKIKGVDVKYIYVGSPKRCPTGCSVLSSNSLNSPNANFEMDSMLSVIAHEIAEVASDPVFNAWYDANGEENADKCSWTYGIISETIDDRLYNVEMGLNKYLIQQNWGLYPEQACYQ